MQPDGNIAVSEQYFTASGVVSQKPCWLYSVILYGAAANANDIKLYDGQDTSGKLREHIGSAQYTTTPVILTEPKFFSKGLYLEVVAGTCTVSFQWREHLR